MKLLPACQNRVPRRPTPEGSDVYALTQISLTVEQNDVDPVETNSKS